MKKLFVILGNKTFEGKLVEELSSHYKHVGSSNEVNDTALQEIANKEVNTLIVRESLADSQQAFSDFIEKSLINNPKLKIIAIIQNRPVADPFIYKIVSLGVYDIINGGTRLSDMIDFSLREGNPENVFSLLSEEQKNAISSKRKLFSKAKKVNVEDEDISIVIEGELSIENRKYAAGFRERYLSGMTQVYSPVEPDDEVESKDVTSVNEPGQNNVESSQDDDISTLPGYVQTMEILTTHEQITEPVQEDSTDDGNKPVEDKDITPLEEALDDNHPMVKRDGKILLYFVTHCLASSVAMQTAVELSKNKNVYYIETHNRNQQLTLSLEKYGIRRYMANSAIDGLRMALEVAGEVDIVLVNLHDEMPDFDIQADWVNIEIIQDKDLISDESLLFSKYPQAMVVVSYFDPNLSSIKSLNKGLGRTMVRWSNTRIEEYNSRLNSKLLANEAVYDVIKGVQ